jgi:hypothetical protein
MLSACGGQVIDTFWQVKSEFFIKKYSTEKIIKAKPK